MNNFYSFLLFSPIMTQNIKFLLINRMKNFFISYQGLPKQVWIFGLMTAINRIGAMVVPFLSKYLYDDLNFSYAQIGTIMLLFGVGSFGGTLIVAKLSNYFSSYKLMVFSMFTSGTILFFMQYVTAFYFVCCMVFAYSFVADMFRPVMIATLKDYVGKQDRIKALTLIRVASNFGFLVSPLLAGIFIMGFSYSFLFIFDSLSSVLAIITFVLFVKEKKVLHKLVFKNYQDEKFPFLKDNIFLVHCFVAVLTGFVFFQIFTVFPLFYTNYLKLSTSYVSFFLVFYGLIVFLLEIPLVEYIRQKKWYSLNVIMFGLLFLGLGYILLAVFPSLPTVFISLLMISIGSMLTFSFATDFVLKRSYKTKEGKFLSFFQISYSIAHILSAKLGFYIVDHFGYKANFLANFAVVIVGVTISYFLIKSSKKQYVQKKEAISKSFFGR